MNREVGPVVRALRKLDVLREEANERYHSQVRKAVTQDEVIHAGQVHRAKCRLLNSEEKRLKIMMHEKTAGGEYTTNGSCSWSVGAGRKQGTVNGVMSVAEEVAKVLAVEEKPFPRGQTINVFVGEGPFGENAIGEVRVARVRTREEGRKLTDDVVAYWKQKDASMFL
jgi:hypothetical protein